MPYHADLTDEEFPCPTVRTLTTNCKNTVNEYSYCIVVPDDEGGCELLQSCLGGADPVSLSCDSMNITTIEYLPTTSTVLELGFNALSEFKPNYDAPLSIKTISFRYNEFTSLDDIELPATVQSVDLAFNKIDTLSFSPEFSNVITLSVSHNPITTVTGSAVGIANLDANNISLANLGDLVLPSTIRNLEISSNPNMTFNNFTAPSDLTTFTATSSAIKSLEKLDFSTASGLSTINFSGNQISSVLGVQFPPKLRTLNINGSDISCFIVRESDVDALTALTAFNVTSLSQDGCDSAYTDGAAARSLDIGGTSYDFTVVDDSSFLSHFYPERVEPTPAPAPEATKEEPSSSSSSSTTIIIIIAVITALIVLLLAYIFYRRRQRQNKDMTYNQLTTPTGQTGGTGGAHGAIAAPLNDIRSDPELVKFRVPQADVQRTRILAKGGYGIVYLASLGNREVVAKQILPEKAKDSRAISRFMDEMRLCAKLSHPNIVQFIGLSWSTLADIAVLTEYMAKGDLAVLLRSQAALPRHREQFTWANSAGQIKRTKLELAIDIIKALVYLHRLTPSIIHRDLKAQNVLLNDSCVAKLADFGVSREVDEAMTAEVGTVAWIAPEVLKGKLYSEQADIYSFGVVLSEIDTCEKPYTKGIQTASGGRVAMPSNARIALAVSEGSLRPDLHEDCPEAIRCIAQRCFAANPTDRPSALELLAELCALQDTL
ncbi:hypothetical protein Poli38472_014343 [Pythium oligandrum]|uniref:Protein kinase domain-containing protein n=1 Tax=Pythium oligandrum TaxID=41045 RepID=A0A8K1C7I9_PYTOL|nr:hypothetical protein Poli38472_014343 [Pythium oligandrum]|eukprot:TMW57740.1 hypothetical protein Poli38472_014343 [Pythium oligandrum]